MTKEEKNQVIEKMSIKLAENEHFYLTDISDLTVEDSNSLRGAFHKKGIRVEVIKNTLLQKAMEKVEGKELQLSYADNIKFMAVVNPELNNRLQIDLKVKYDTEQDVIKVNSITHFDEQVFYKFKGNFKAK